MKILPEDTLKFSENIINIISENPDIEVSEAILLYIEENEIDFADVEKLISPKLKDMLRSEFSFKKMLID